MSRKENALDLAKFIDKGVRVKLSGGREGANISFIGYTVLLQSILRSQCFLLLRVLPIGTV
jgi:hypothetical protein